jgi:hypothetical protein
MQELADLFDVIVVSETINDRVAFPQSFQHKAIHAKNISNHKSVQVL